MAPLRLCLLVAFLALYLTQTTYGVHPNLRLLNTFRKGVLQQERFRGVWNRLIDTGDITRTTTRINNRDADFYILNGRNVRKMQLKDVFYMLQTRAEILPDRNHRMFQVNIAGKDHKFRMARAPRGKDQLLIFNENGHDPPYQEIWDTFEKAVETDRIITNEEIASLILKATHAPVEDQPRWQIGDKNLKDNMRNLMLLSQVAEAAPGTSDFLLSWNQVVDSVTDRIVSKENVWKQEVDRAFQDGTFSSQEQYNELLNSVEMLQMASDQSSVEAARNEIRQHFPTATEETFNKLIEAATRTDERYTTSVETAGKWYRTRIQNLRPKSGRVPGSDEQVRQLLERIANPADTEFTSFAEPFRRYFPIIKETQLGRSELFDLGPHFKDPSEGNIGELSTRRLQPDTVAVADGDKSALEAAIEDSLRKDGCLKRRKRAASCSYKKIRLVEESLEWSGNTLSFTTVDEEGREKLHSLEVDTEDMKTPEHVNERVANARESGALETTQTALGYYGAFVSILASAHYFSQGDYGRGTFSTIQSTHIVGGLTGVNEVIERASKRAFNKVITISAEKVGLEKALDRMVEVGAERLGEAGIEALGRVSPVGLFFDGYFIYEDVKDLQDQSNPLPKSLRVTHLALDSTITALTLALAIPGAQPFVLPAIIGLTIVRLAIDDFYIDIKDELEQVKGQGFLAQVAAVERGIAEGIVDVLTLKLNQQLKQYERQVGRDNELLRNLADPVSYFNVTFQGLDENGQPVGEVNFNAGMLSQYGGFLTVKLNDDGSFTVTLPQVTEDESQMLITRTFRYDHPVNDIVLGVGEIAHPQYVHEEAKLWLVIPVKGYEVIDRLEGHQSSRYGVYTGNDQGNNFYSLQGDRRRRGANVGYKDDRNRIKRQAAQDCQSPSGGNEVKMLLSSYHYDLYGRGGNDRFFLGPQSAQVTGGEDNDLYFLQPNGGKTIIDNFAHDEEMDTLFLNVSYSDLVCHRDGLDLLVSYCTTHAVKVKNWFAHANEEFHHHMYIATMDGIGVEVMKTDLSGTQHDVTCAAVSVDKSRSTSSETVILTGSFSEVTQVIGSNYSDTIVGNDKANILRGGRGNDYLKGGNGSDMYLVKKGDDTITIDNYAFDREQDTLIIGVIYSEIAVRVDPSNPSNLIIYDSTSAAETQIKLTSWFDGAEWQHLSFVSKDYVQFKVGEDEDGLPLKHPLSIDLSQYQYGVRVDLKEPVNSVNITIISEEADEVSVMLDSPHNDVLIGNDLGNFMGCSGGSDILQGNGGKDSYIIDPTCVSVTINNLDESQDYDIMLLRFTSHQIRILPATSNDLFIRCEDGSSQVVEVHLKNWFQSELYQHLMLKTTDKISAFLPTSKTELMSTHGQILPFEIESDEDCGGQSRSYDLTKPEYSRTERFTAKTDACSFNVTGNSLNNYIDPGPDNPFGYQQLTGGNGTDTYVMGHRYGIFNTINNFATDGQVDHLQFDVLFHDIKVVRHALNDVSLTSLSRNDSVRVTLLRYFEGDSHQHLLIHSADGVTFKIQREFPYIHVLIVDVSASSFTQVISAEGDQNLFRNVRVILGSKTAENHIQSGNQTVKVMGGQMNDTIIGGPAGEDLIGMSGDDSIDGGSGDDGIYGGMGNDFLLGGPGDDVIYGGEGADLINGGPGSDMVIFSGWNFTGVEVNLQVGLGWGADAEGDEYDSIESLTGSAYDDILVGNDENNIIKGSGGDDFIVPAGGYDILLGGSGSDFYYLESSSGNKMINNLATDDALDLVILNKTSQEQVCYFFLGDDLEINIHFNVNTSDSFSRLNTAEDFLQITLPFWLKNTTYQHIAFTFLDGVLLPKEFSQTGRQVQPLFDLVISDNFFQIASISGDTICLRFSYSNDVVFHDNVGLEYVHVTQGKTSYHPVVLPPKKNICLDNLPAGVEHTFTLMLTSCNLTVALSPLVTGTTKPSPPTNVVSSSVRFDGFQLSWSPPNVDTDPIVSDYKYIVLVWSDEHQGETFTFVTNSTVFFVHHLIPETVYKASVASRIQQIEGVSTSSVTVTTADNECSNLAVLPPQLYVDDLRRNAAGKIVVFLRCERGYYLSGNSQVICNDAGSSVPSCEPVSCQVPSIANADRIPSTSPVHGDRVRWDCHYGYEVSQYSTSFSSTCQDGLWVPALKSCREKPKCTGAYAPTNGYVTATTAYAGESVTYSCKSGYDLDGVERKTCVRHFSTAYWSPSGSVQCTPQQCPDLLPQPNGAYSGVIKTQYYHGDSVWLTCNSGYYVHDTPSQQNRMQLNCVGDQWSPQQKLCQLIIQVTGITDYITYAIGKVSYVPSSLSTQLVDSSLFALACKLMVNHRVLGVKYYDFNWLTSSFTWNGKLNCSRQLTLSRIRNEYEGIVSVSTTNGNEKVCVKDASSATQVCSALNYDYTASVYTNVNPISTTRTASNGRISSQQENCYHRIKCRQSCNNLYLLNGYDCPYNLEGQTCNFRCSAGYALIGSSYRKCTSSGWTGTHPYCDGELIIIINFFVFMVTYLAIVIGLVSYA